MLVLDEPSEGLAPIIVREIGRVVQGLKGERLSILLGGAKLSPWPAGRGSSLRHEQRADRLGGNAAGLEADEESSVGSSGSRRRRRRVSWIDPDFPRHATPSDRVGRVLGLNPGMMTGPGTNTYLVGHRDPILIDTGAGVPEYMDVLASYLRERGWRQPSRVDPHHRHVDHLGGVPHLRDALPGPVRLQADLQGRRAARGDHEPAGWGRSSKATASGSGPSTRPATLGPLCYFLEEERALFTAISS